MMSYISNKPKRLAEVVKKKRRLVEPQTGPLPVYRVPLKDEKIEIAGCKRYSFGKDSTKRSRTIMVLGATGAGKSTLINGMINYILGVEREDSYRLVLVDEGQSKSQAESQTSEVTVYKLNHQEGFKIPYSLTIVDTPGFGDTRGIDRDRKISEQLDNLFNDDESGVTEIDAVCFVAQASSVRLTAAQKYVFDSVLSIFGKDVAENIRIFVTFADGQSPKVLVAINESGVPCPKAKDGLPVHFKFNNSALFANNQSSAAGSQSGGDDDDNGGFAKMFWTMGTTSMKRFFNALNVIETKSLTMTKEVLKERQQLENSVENLQEQVKVGIATLEEIKVTAEKLKDNEAEINRNKKFEIEVERIKEVKIDISGDKIFVTNCNACNRTCHESCAYKNDDEKRNCCAMGPDGNCTVCKDKCPWHLHHNRDYKWGVEVVKEKQTFNDLKKRYMKASDDKITVEAMIETMSFQYCAVQVEVVKLVESSGKCLNRLKEIALRPNPLSTPDYIDMLIKAEESEAKPGWQQRVESLKEVREAEDYKGKLVRREEFLTKRNVNQYTDTCGNPSKIKSDTKPMSFERLWEILTGRK